ncbi:MAG: choice-of-anchor B family protein [Calditrichaeota bacterium]|nr:choice-of-anchor B family protein [Calditrichota bacterium]
MFLFPYFLVFWGLAQGQGVQNVNVLNRFDLTHHIDDGGSIADVWGFTKEDREFAVIALTETGVTIVDVTDPYNPVEASVIPIPPSASRLYHVKPYKNYLYAVMRPGPLQIIDMTDPYNAFEVTTYSTGFDEVYGLFISDSLAHLYDVESSRSGVSYIILDLSDPENPVELGVWGRTYHHVYTRNDTMFGFVLGGEVDFVDVSDPGSFSLITTWEAGSKSHSGWLNDGGTILTTDHETPGGHMKVWDIPTNGSTPTLISEFETSTNQIGEATLHHTRFYNDFIYTSYWIECFRLIDLSTPALPLEIAVYDTIDPNPDTMYRGFWGTYPYNPSRNILSTDAKFGLIILDYHHDGPGIQHRSLDSLVMGGNSIRGEFNRVNGTSVDVASSSVFWRTTHNGAWQQTAIDSSGQPDQYFFEITLPGQASTLEYYLQVKGTNGRKTKAPGMAPHLEYYTSSIFNSTFNIGQDVYISEVSDAANTQNEFLEIHNLSNNAIDLDGFKLVQFEAGSDLRYNKSVYVFDFGQDENGVSSTIIPANGFLIIARGANQSGFETEWGSLPVNANYNSGNNNLLFGETNAYRWVLLSSSNSNKADGVYIDDSQSFIAGSGFRSYQVSVGNWNTTSYTGATPGKLDGDQSLPVSLISFKALKKENGVQLNWQTKSELNNVGFTILQSYEKSEGYSHIDDYSTNKSLKGLGTNSHGKEYSYFDNTGNANSVLFYKLQQTDFNGSTEEFGPLSVNLDNQKPQDFQLLQNYPNPFNIETVFRFYLPKKKDRISISIFAVSGEKVRSINLGSLKKGYHTYTWNGKNNNNEVVASGIYFYSIVYDKTRFSKKLILIK